MRAAAAPVEQKEKPAQPETSHAEINGQVQIGNFMCDRTGRILKTLECCELQIRFSKGFFQFYQSDFCTTDATSQLSSWRVLPAAFSKD